MKRSESIKSLAEALAKAQRDIPSVAFDKVNPHFRSKYASLTAIWDAVRRPLTDNGLSVSQGVVEMNGRFVCVTVLFHVSGEWLETEQPMLLGKQDMQGLGSAETYAKRYALASLLGVVSDDDDDGNAAVQAPQPRPQARSQVPAVTNVSSKPAMAPGGAEAAYWAQAIVSMEDKELAKEAGFRWNAAKKMWVKQITPGEAGHLPFETKAVG